MNYVRNLRSFLARTGIFVLFFLFLSIPCGYGQFEELDKIARNTPIKGMTTEKLAAVIAEKTNSDEEKLRFLFVYIAQNIEYDLAAYQKGEFSFTEPNDVLKNRRTVCQGYCNLFHDVCQRLGIRTEIAEGLSKGFGFSGKLNPRSDHTWIVAFANQQWVLIEPTWGSGYVRNGKFVKAFDQNYFFTPPYRFVTNHLPTDPAQQLLPCPIKPSDFLKDSLAIVSLATQCDTPYYSFADTLAVDYSVSDSLRILRKARRKAQYADFGKLNAAVEINTLATSLTQKINTPAPPSQQRIDEAQAILPLLTEALNYAKQSKSPDAKSIQQMIESNINNIKEFIDANQKALRGKSR